MAPVKAKLNIVLLGTQMEYGGAQRLLLAQARWFQDQGHEVQAVFLYDKMGLAETWKKDNPFSLVNLNAWVANRFWLLNLPAFVRGLFQLRKLLQNADVIEAFTSHSNLIGIPLAWLSGVKIRLATLHGYLAGPFGLIPLVHGRLVNSRLTSKLVAVSEHVKETAMRTENLDPQKVVVIPNGISISLSNGNEVDRATFLRQNQIPEDALIVLAVGRLVPAKGHEVLLKAWASLRPKNCRLVIVGEGPLRPDLESQANQLGIDDSIHFLGSRDDVFQWLRVADIYVQPSLREGLSIALLEAMSAGIAIVASKAGAAEEMIEDEESGLLVSPGAIEELAAAIDDLIKRPEKRKPFGEKAKLKVASDFSSDRMCAAYESLMYRLAEDEDKN